MKSPWERKPTALDDGPKDSGAGVIVLLAICVVVVAVLGIIGAVRLL